MLSLFFAVGKILHCVCLFALNGFGLLLVGFGPEVMGHTTWVLVDKWFAGHGLHKLVVKCGGTIWHVLSDSIGDFL